MTVVIAKIVASLLVIPTFQVSTTSYLGKLTGFIFRDIPEIKNAVVEYRSCDSEEEVLDNISELRSEDSENSNAEVEQ